MGLKILSNAKIKKPIDCSHQSPKYSAAMGRGKLPLWLVESLINLELRISERFLLASCSFPEPLASEWE